VANCWYRYACREDRRCHYSELLTTLKLIHLKVDTLSNQIVVHRTS
jgi:hypothetical protein